MPREPPQLTSGQLAGRAANKRNKKSTSEEAPAPYPWHGRDRIGHHLDRIPAPRWQPMNTLRRFAIWRFFAADFVIAREWFWDGMERVWKRLGTFKDIERGLKNFFL